MRAVKPAALTGRRSAHAPRALKGFRGRPVDEHRAGRSVRLQMNRAIARDVAAGGTVRIPGRSHPAYKCQPAAASFTVVDRKVRRPDPTIHAGTLRYSRQPSSRDARFKGTRGHSRQGSRIPLHHFRALATLFGLGMRRSSLYSAWPGPLPPPDAWMAMPVLGIHRSRAGVFILILSLPGVIAGIGLLKTGRGRGLYTIVLSALNLMTSRSGRCRRLRILGVMLSDEGSRCSHGAGDT